MKDLSFSVTPPDQETLFDFEPSLFHRSDYVLGQRLAGWQHFRATNSKARVIASLLINIDGSTARSSVRAPYGMVECSNDIAPDDLFAFLENVDRSLSGMGLESVELRLSPQAYAPRVHAMVMSFLQALGYTTRHVDLSSCISVNDRSLAQQIRRTEQQVLHKAEDAGITAAPPDHEIMATVYDFIAACHTAKQYPLSVSRTDMVSMAEKFPHRYITFSAKDGSTTVAAAIGIRVLPEVMSLFYIDHNPSYHRLSPAILVIVSMYAYCQANKITLLDLGTSTLNGKPNLGLLSFKLRLNAVPSIKPTLFKEYRS